MKVLKNLDTLYRQERMFWFSTLGVLTFFVGIVCFFLIQQQREVFDRWDEKLNQSYVLVGGDVYEIQRVQNEGVVRVIEAQGHVENFHNAFFNLDPDPAQIKQQIEGKALNWVDASGKLHYDYMSNQGYFRDLVAGNVTQFIEYNEPVQIDTLSDYRVQFTVKATQWLERSTSLVKRSLVTTGYLRTVDKTSTNRYGFLIMDWNVVENKDLEVIEVK